jgi:hypothetical protein
MKRMSSTRTTPSRVLGIPFAGLLMLALTAGLLAAFFIPVTVH